MFKSRDRLHVLGFEEIETVKGSGDDHRGYLGMKVQFFDMLLPLYQMTIHNIKQVSMTFKIYGGRAEEREPPGPHSSHTVSAATYGMYIYLLI